jgi:hypothetical protein
MALTDVFTGAPGVAAAGANKDLLTGAQQSIAQRTQATKNTAGGFLDQGYGAAGGALAQGYDAAGNAINTGASGALGYLDQGTQGALDQLGQARTDLTANGGAFAPLSALAGQYGKGAGLYADALGVNGAAGNASATDAFHAAPGFQFALNTGLDSINRAANARGQANSGNTDINALKYGTGLADQGYQQWLQNLSPFNNLQLSATQGAASGNAGINQSLAGIDTTGAGYLNAAGTNKAGIATGQGSSLADLARAYYGGQANLDTSRGTALAGNETGANQTITGADLNLVPQIAGQNTAAANAQMAGSGNLWNLGLNAAKLAAGVAGGFGGVGGGGGTGGSLMAGAA